VALGRGSSIGRRARRARVDLARGQIAGAAARVDGSHLTTTRHGAKVATIARLVATAESDALSAHDPLRRGRFTAQIDRAAVGDVAAITDLLPDGVTLEARPGAIVTSYAALEKDRDVVDGSLQVHAVGLGARTAKLHATADVDATGSARVDLAARQIDLRDADVTITRVAGGFGPAGRVDFEGGRIALSARTAGPYDLARPTLRGLDARLRVADVALLDARALNRVLPAGEVLAVESGTARVAADLATSASNGTGSGRAVVELTGARVRLHDARVRGDVVVDARVARFDPASNDADVHGTHVAMRGVHVSSGSSADAHDWYGDLVVERGLLRLGDAPAIDADVILRAKNARPALALLLGDGVPRMVVPWIDMPNLVAAMHLVVEPKLLVVGDFVAGSANLGPPRHLRRPRRRGRRRLRRRQGAVQRRPPRR
jgi:hypothetical protein